MLFQVTATPEWSKLPLSGLFVDMLHRMVDVSQGVPADGSVEIAGALAPHMLLDGRGRLIPPGATVAPVPGPSFEQTLASAKTPPGLYGPPGATRALNLAAHLPEPAPLAGLPLSANHMTFNGLARERNFKPWLLSLALILLLADMLVSFFLRRLMPTAMRFKSATAAALLFACLAGIGDVRAADVTASPNLGPLRDIDAATRAGVLETRLAYVGTGMGDVDRMVGAGLTALTQVLADRSAAELAPPLRLDLNAPLLNTDSLTPYPLIYWRITATTQIPPARALTAINDYLHRGGMVVFDAPEQAGALGGTGGGMRERLNEVLSKLDIPQVVEMNDDHVLNRAFYLLHGLPGRYSAGLTMIERDATANDGVSSVIIGGADWAAAWAKDGSNVPMYAVIPGGEQQREMAYRAGVNMLIYALTGNYKADQVHAPAILQRLNQ